MERLTRKVSLPTVHPFVGEEDPLRILELKAQALSARRRMLLEGGLVDAMTMARRLCISQRNLLASVARGRLFSVDIDGSTYYPAFFASSEYDLESLERVNRVLGRMPCWSKLDFFTEFHGALGMSPLSALVRGLTSQTLALAAAVAQDE